MYHAGVYLSRKASKADLKKADLGKDAAMHAKKNFKVGHSASMRPEDWLRFIHIDPFPGQWKRLKLSEEDLQALEVFIASAPTMAPVVPGSGGLRKFRFAVPGSQRGKSGAYRVFYVYFEDYGHVILWAII